MEIEIRRLQKSGIENSGAPLALALFYSNATAGGGAVHFVQFYCKYFGFS